MFFKNPTGHKTILLSKNEYKTIHLEDFSNHSSDFSLEIVLKGDNSVVEVFGRAQSLGKSKKKWCLKLIFKGLNQRGVLDLRGTAEDASLLIFDGSALLEQKSVEAEVKITEKIVLFDSARGQCLPVLTVKTDKVKSASHAASIAPFESEKVLFCQSRGIDQKESENLLKKGFLKVL